MTKKPPHTIASDAVVFWLARVLPEGWYCSAQNPLSIPEDDSEPEPDAKVVRGRPQDYRDRQPGPRDVALVVEVSDTSLPYDRRLKLRVYAAGGRAGLLDRGRECAA